MSDKEYQVCLPNEDGEPAVVIKGVFAFAEAAQVCMRANQAFNTDEWQVREISEK